jgi:drug/metabolite transporter (DMT)-like permease
MNDSDGNANHYLYAVFLAVISAILFGAAVPASKFLLSSLNTFTLAGLLYLGAAMGTAPFAFKKTNRVFPWQMNRQNQFCLIGAIIFGGILAPVFMLFGLHQASAASVSLWLPLELAATAILGRFIFRDQLGLIGWLGLAGILAAGLLLCVGEASAGIRAGALVAVACLCWGFDNNFTALIDSLSPSQSAFWKGLCAGIFNLSLGFAGQSPALSLIGIAGALAVGMFAYGLSIALYIGASQSLGATRAQMIFAGGPFFGVILSLVFLGEAISAVQMIAAGALFGSLALVFLDKHRHAHFHNQLEHGHSHRHDDIHHNHPHQGIGADTRHTHVHKHEPAKHTHSHLSDLHHRHKH